MTRPSPRRTARRWWIAAFGLLAVVVPGDWAGAQPPRPVVYVAPVEGIIDLGLA
ncbi:MAG: hypothetical protein HYY85_01690, partial [Deltaproteobacteria bacterium]|nr:hypothetical protein [Deltaproteobacteria bacterium]